MEAHPLHPGDPVLDLGCGFGDTTQRLAELVGPAGEVVGIDVAEPFIDVARREAGEALAEFDGPDGVFAPASTWIIGATAP